MTDIPIQTSLLFAAAVFFTAGASAQPWSALQTVPRPNQSTISSQTSALCLPPGATGPVACGTARPGQTIRLRIATTSLPTGPINLLFAEEAAAGQAPRTASLTIPPVRSRDGGYEVTVPATLCAAGKGGQMGQYEIQHLMSTYNQSESARRSLGTITVAC